MVDLRKALYQGIDVSKKIVTASHNFIHKLIDFQSELWDLSEKYSKYDPRLEPFFKSIITELNGLTHGLTVTQQGEVHILLEKEAALKRSKGWALKYLQKTGPGGYVAKKKYREREVDKIFIVICKEHFQRMKQLFLEGEELFQVDIRTARILKVKIELGRAEAGFKELMEKVLALILAYEKIFQDAEKELEES
ncbi:MAG: hypothetical protein V2A62_03950 [Candidatus Woesearchaeota archaeon]